MIGGCFGVLLPRVRQGRFEVLGAVSVGVGAALRFRTFPKRTDVSGIVGSDIFRAHMRAGFGLFRTTIHISNEVRRARVTELFYLRQSLQKIKLMHHAKGTLSIPLLVRKFVGSLYLSGLDLYYDYRSLGSSFYTYEIVTSFCLITSVVLGSLVRKYSAL